jgi:hypothetical protein
VFGDGHAAAHPELVATVLMAATVDQAAAVIASALLGRLDASPGA